MTYLINVCFTTNSFPNIYKSAIVTPLYKKGDPTLFSNYRPIAMLPIMSKVIEFIMSKQIKDFLDNSQKLSNRQFGFRKHTSTADMLHYILDIIANALDKKKSQYVMLLSVDTEKRGDISTNKLSRF